MGERLEQVVRQSVAKFGYGIAGNTVFDRATGLVLHEAEDAEWAYDFAVDMTLSGESSAHLVLRERRRGAREMVELLETQLDACETEVEYSAVYVELDAAWRRWETLQ
jgi:hypothetical protein